MSLVALLDHIKGNHRYATADDIRKVFGDYHNALHWLAVFLIGDENLADACVVDACTIAQIQTPMFHEWLVQWAALATLRSALRMQQPQITELAAEYDKREPVQVKHPPLSPKQFHLLIKNSEDIHASLDVLCRFVLIMRGIAKDSWEEVAAKLGVSQSVVERAYCIAFDALEVAFCNADVSPGPTVSEAVL